MIISKLYHLQLEDCVKQFNLTNKKKTFDEILSQYTVKKGDTLFDIVKKHLHSQGFTPSDKDIMKNVEKIAKANNITNPNLIFPGQTIKFNDLNYTNSTAKFIFPVDKGYISSKYGMRLDPFTKHMRFHAGIDIAAPIGTPVKAAAAGKVIFSGKQRGYGNIVIIEHKNGFISKYAHNSKNLVHVGDMVKQGDEISLIGSTGRSTGPHVHFEVRKNHKSINPLQFLNV